jgi:multimeric flavodoxin WrbA
MPQLTAVLLNCTLKPSPAASDTEALLRKVAECYDRMDVASEIVRVADFAVKFGVTSDEGEGDEWPLILARIKMADIVVMGMPIVFGVRSSVAQLVMERLDGTYVECNEAGQYPLYNKVGGVVVTRSEDGAHTAAETTLFNLSQLGCTIPPNVDTYSESATRRMAYNTVHLARLLNEHPIPAENPLPRKLFGGLATEAGGIDAEALEVEKRAAEEGRLLERRRLLDLTWLEKGLPEKRKPRPPIDPGTEGTAPP